MSNKFLVFYFAAVMTIAFATTKPAAASGSCHSYIFTSAGNNKFKSCSDLPVLNSFIHWTFYPESITADIAFRKTGTSTNSWVAWSLNPNGQTMLGSQALVAFHSPEGIPTALTTQVNNYNPSMQNMSLTFGVSNIKAEYSNGEMIIFATLQLDNSLVNTNHNWQEGPMLGGTNFGAHPTFGVNRRCVGTIDFSTGETTAGTHASSSSKKLKYIHAFLNSLSWGIMIPIGINSVRLLKAVNIGGPNVWTYTHAACQTFAYLIGVAGWATGMVLGGRSHGITHTNHKVLGIIIFACATLQVLSLYLRPNPNNQYIRYWNIYHASIGYFTYVTSVLNILEGLYILQPGHMWTYVFEASIFFLLAYYIVTEITVRLKTNDSNALAD